MSFEGLLHVSDPVAGAWIAPRLCGFGSRVCSVVPQGFEAYARILHPPDTNAAPVPRLRWADVCAVTGATPHALMQWHSITRTRYAANDRRTQLSWDGPAPAEGDLTPGALEALLAVLAPFTSEQNCYFAIWEGWGWVTGAGVAVMSASSDQNAAWPGVTHPEPGVPPAALAAPRLRHPHRDYVLFQGPLAAATRIGHPVAEVWPLPQSPSLMWPADRSWCVATEVDFDSTLVAGSADLVEAVLSATALEAWPVRPHADLGLRADLVNGRQ